MGLLAALGGLFSNDDGTPNGLQRFGNALDPAGALVQQQAQDAQTKNQLQKSALAMLAQNQKNGITNPQQNLNSLAQIDPQYTEKAAMITAQNPLGALLQGGTNAPAAQSPAQSPNGQGGAPLLPWQQPSNGGNTLANLTGDDLLKALPPAVAAQVKGYSEGKLPYSPYMMKTPQGQQLMQLVSQYDPSFDAADYPARAATYKSFHGGGPDANNITALNTAMGHAKSLQDAYDKLDNGDYSSWNSIKNATESALGSTTKQSAMATVQSTAHALSEELAKVFRSTGMAESDVKAWEKQITTSATPAQSKAVLNSAMELMNSRLDALGEKYNQGMKTSKKGIELLSPKAQAAYQAITGNAPAETKAGGTANQNTAASSQSAAASQTPEAPTATNPKTGAKMVFKGGKWQAL